MISFIVPAYNEEESLVELFKELCTVAQKLSSSYEIIAIDDGSTDNSLQILKNIARKNKKLLVFSFRKNMGKAEALTFGFVKARGSIIISLDADLQDKPTEIAKLLKKYKEGYDLVSGWRKKRKDAKKMVIISKLFNFTLSRFFGFYLHDYNCGMKVYSRKAAKSLRLYGGLHRFIPLLLFQEGYKIAELPVIHQKRKFGKSKYGFSKLWKDIPDIFTILFLIKYSKRPMHFFGFIGGILFSIGFIILVYLTVIHFLGSRIGSRPLLFFGMLLVLTGVQVFFTGFLADFMLHISEKETLFDDGKSFPLKFPS